MVFPFSFPFRGQPLFLGALHPSKKINVLRLATKNEHKKGVLNFRKEKERRTGEEGKGKGKAEGNFLYTDRPKRLAFSFLLFRQRFS